MNKAGNNLLTFSFLNPYFLLLIPMIPVDFPPPEFKVKQEDSKELIFDPLRRRWLILTPEEWVRQNFVQYLVQVKKISGYTYRDGKGDLVRGIEKKI